MRKTIAALAFAAAISAAMTGAAATAAAAPSAHTPAGHHHPCPPRNKHCRPVKPPMPPASCVWVIGGAIGDTPRCVSS
jgi:hypothetical protein